MKRFLALALALIMVLGLAACAKGPATEKKGEEELLELVPLDNMEVVLGDDTDYSNVKVGFIFLHDPNQSTYDNNFYQAALNVQKELGLSDDQVMYKWNIPEEGTDCYDTAKEMVNAGCNIIFADSFGHESNMVLAAKDFPEVQFAHATGTQAIVAKLDNYHNAFADIYQGRYLAGIAAGMKLNEMIENGDITAEQAKIGYVGAHPYAEVISGFTSFFLGARSICPSATMEVVYTNSWFDIALEKESAENLIKSGCVLISQHADSEGAPKACEAAGVPNVAYNVDTTKLGPTTALISSKINWEPYFKLMIECVATGKAIPTDWCGSIASDSVQLTALNDAAAAEGTQEAIDEAKAKIIAGELDIYSTDTFTVDGKKLDKYAADVVDAGDFVGETNAVVDGVFCESVGRSAPYFNVIIDGITEK